MKKTIVFLMMLLCFEMPLQADYIVLSEGEVLAGDNIHQTQSVASISKVMTALVALESADVSNIVTIDHETTLQIGSSLYVQENEQYSLLSLLYGLMLRSGNDAAYAIATHVGKDVDQFVKMMNDKAKELGMIDTVFSNPSGLDETDGGNISSLYDMALCMQAAMKNEIFRMIVNTRQYAAENQRVWLNKNRLLGMYESCNGGKTGYTVKSGKTLITSAYENGLESIVVSFREGDYFMLHKRLHEDVYLKYKTVLLIEKGTYKIQNKRLSIQEDIQSLIPIDGEVFVEVLLENDAVLIRYKNLDTVIERREILT